MTRHRIAVEKRGVVLRRISIEQPKEAMAKPDNAMAKQ